MKELEERGEFLEKELRRAIQAELEASTQNEGVPQQSSSAGKMEEYMLEWINLLFKKRSLTTREEQLRSQENAKRMEYLGNLVDHALRKYMERSDADKSRNDLEHENWLLQEWLKLVQERDTMVQKEESLRVESQLISLKLSPSPSSPQASGASTTPATTPASSPVKGPPVSSGRRNSTASNCAVM